MEDLTLLHVGCGGKYYDGFINCDMTDTTKRGRKYKVDKLFRLEDPWPFENESVDGIVGMGVFQQLYWRELIRAFKEAYRVLRAGGALRIGTPLIENGFPLDHILGWNNTNLFNYSLLEDVLINHIKFSTCRLQNLRHTVVEEFKKVDNRTDHMFYIEATK